MQLLSTSTGWLFLVTFGITMVLLTVYFARGISISTKESFLLANREVRWWVGGPSIAASWIWAGALFVSIQMSYQKGSAGLFWFLFPNVIALAIYVLLGPRIRKRFPNGYTLPQWIRYRLGSERVHRLYLVPFFFNQVVATTFNIFAGASMIWLITGIPITIGMPVMVVIALIYSLISGLRASIVTDFLQLLLILLACVIIVPWVVALAGGVPAIAGGLGGLGGQVSNMFEPSVAFSFGIVTSIGLISQTISDQQYWQRVFAVRTREIPQAFAFGAILFALVPLSLSMLGFMAANDALGIELPEGTDPALIGVLTVNHYLPIWAVMFYVIALLGALSSTIDSGLAATASLFSTDVARHSREESQVLLKQSLGRELTPPEADVLSRMDRRTVRNSRLAMAGISVIGLLFAYASYYIGEFAVKNLFLISISVVASVSVPTVLSLYWDRLDAKGVFWGPLLAIVIGLPSFIWANYIGSDPLMVGSSIFMIGISSALCFAFPSKTPALAGEGVPSA